MYALAPIPVTAPAEVNLVAPFYTAGNRFREVRVLDSDKGWGSVPGIGLRVTESEMAEKRGEKREREHQSRQSFLEMGQPLWCKWLWSRGLDPQVPVSDLKPTFWRT